jgi:hypothetical protein
MLDEKLAIFVIATGDRGSTELFRSLVEALFGPAALTSEGARHVALTKSVVTLRYRMGRATMPMAALANSEFS